MNSMKDTPKFTGEVPEAKLSKGTWLQALKNDLPKLLIKWRKSHYKGSRILPKQGN